VATKNTDRCLQKVSDDEPIFVLRAQDRLAPALVRQWAREMLQHGCIGLADDDADIPANIDKIEEIRARAKEACDQADEMERWHTRKYPD
jgi:hypothetical protein